MEAMIAGLAGFLAGWVVRAMQQPRGSYGRLSDEQPPMRMTVDEWALKYGSQLDPGRPRHPGSDNGGPTTPKPPIKPQPSGGRMIREDQWNPGWEYLNGPNPPPSEP